ncbi:MAG: MarR family winged helix-turn-helix transcriptional regulator [Halioglobus sp.]
MNQKNPNICLAHTLRRADRVVNQLYNEHLAPVGLRVTQFTILRTLALTGTTTASQIRTTLVMDQTTVSRALKPLIRDGYITVGEGANKREKALSLSAEGKKLYQQALGPWGDAQKMLRKKLAGGQEDILIKLSREIVAMKG